MAWAESVGVQPREIHLRQMKRKVASCSSRGRLTFDPSLLDQEPKRRAEVIVHELLHLRYPNHGKMFDALLRAHIGDRPEAPTE
ncbi:MAG: M48 family metallopeptidase [Planctomycetota bacterium]